MMDKNAKIYVAGHRGMVGSAIVRELQRQGYNNIITRTHKELDLCRQENVEKFFAEEKPEYVFLAAAKVGGIVEPVTAENVSEFGMLRLMDSPKMKGMLNSTSMPNWYHCIDEALRKSGMTRKDIGYLDILHIKRSGHKAMLADLGLTEDQTIYLEDYGHIGQVDQILSLKLALEQGKVKDGTVISMIAAGIGYTWAANVIKWG